MTGFDPSQQIELLNQKTKGFAQILYKAQADYLEVLRSSLLYATRQSIISIIKNYGLSFNSQIKEEVKKEFQNKVDKLVSNCSSLLTVEQLMELSVQLEEEYNFKREEAKQQLLMAINQQKTNLEEVEGSINLSFAPPIENSDYLEGVDLPKINENNEDSSSKISSSLEEENHNEDILSHRKDQKINKQSSFESQGIKPGKLDLLKSIFLIAGNAGGKVNKERVEVDDTSTPDLGTESFSMRDDAQNAFLPSSPIALVSWLNSIELALNRRLRNLSHALNVELIRVGIINSLLPVSLLDAAISGQLETLSAPSNVLKLKIPMNKQMTEEGVEIIGLLIRSTELEFDNSHLRMCRNELRQLHLSLLTMVRQQKHWQNRLTEQDIQEGWWQDPSQTSN